MTNIVWPAWPRTARPVPSADSAAAAESAVLHAETALVRAKLAIAYEDGRLIVAAMSDHLREIEQTIDFCRSCRDALGAGDLDEMTRLRDVLSAALQRMRSRRIP